MKLRTRRHQISITNPKRLFIALGVVVIALFALYWFWPSSTTVSPFDEQATLPCYRDCQSATPVAYNLPLPAGREREAFVEQAEYLGDSSYFYSRESWARIKGTPTTFDVYLPSGSLDENDPDYRVVGDKIYVRAAILPSDDAARLNEIVADDAADEDEIVLGFDKTLAPQPGADVFLRVWGVPYWTSQEINESSPTNLPVVMVAAWDSVTKAELRAPADFSYEPKFAMRRGDVQLSVKSVEFAPPAEIRVKVSLRNFSTDTPFSWASNSVTLLGANGEIYQPVEPSDQNTDALDASDIPPGGVTRSGTIFFPYVDPSKGISLSLPDPAEDSSNTVRLKIPTSEPGLVVATNRSTPQ